MVNCRVDVSHGEIVACAPSSFRSVTPRRDVSASVGVTKYGGRIPTPRVAGDYCVGWSAAGLPGQGGVLATTHADDARDRSRETKHLHQIGRASWREKETT